MATLKQNRDYSQSVLPNDCNFLDDSLDWIRDNLDPEDVFTEDQLGDWAIRHDYISPFTISPK